MRNRWISALGIAVALAAGGAVCEEARAEIGKLLLTLHNPTPSYDDYFGCSLAAVGSNIVVGSDYAREAYVFNGQSGSLLRTLGGYDGYFGCAVAAMGNRVIIGNYGAYGPYGQLWGSGEAYLADPQTGAVLRTYPNPRPDADAHFGFAVASAGGNILVGAPEDNGQGRMAGAAQLINPTTGQGVRTFTSPAPSAYQDFGWSLATSDHLIAIGAPNVDASGPNGAVYLFDAGTGNLIRSINRLAEAVSGEFGRAVALVGDDVLVGAPRVNGAKGAAYLFDQDGVLLHTFRPPANASTLLFGSAVAAFGNEVLIGAPDNSSGSNHGGGEAYLFDTLTGNLLYTFRNPERSQDDAFGSSFQVIGDSILIGAYRDWAGAQGAGSAYLFSGVPEPATLSLLALGGLAILRRRHR